MDILLFKLLFLGDWSWYFTEVYSMNLNIVFDLDLDWGIFYFDFVTRTYCLDLLTSVDANLKAL